MNFEQAVYQMFSGAKVRLSDWQGYWFVGGPVITKELNKSTIQLVKDYSSIRVFTRDGDILDTPNIDRYKDRDDWEAYEHTGWSFDMALRFLKNGKRVQRGGWNGKGMWIQLVGSSVFSMGGEVFNATPYLQIKSVNGTVTPWLASQTDLLATDWEIVI